MIEVLIWNDMTVLPIGVDYTDDTVLVMTERLEEVWVRRDECEMGYILGISPLKLVEGEDCFWENERGITFSLDDVMVALGWGTPVEYDPISLHFLVLMC